MTDERPKKRDRFKQRIVRLFKSSEAPEEKPSKRSRENNTGNSRTSPSIAIPSSSSVLAPRNQTAISSMQPATASFDSSLDARSLDAARNEGFPSDSARQSRRPSLAATECTADALVSIQEEQPHTPTATIVIFKAQSLWSTEFNSNKLDDRERETLKDIDFAANADESVSQARSSAEELLQEKKNKFPKIQKLLSYIDRFKEIGDIVVQYDPVHAALPWAGVRLLIKLCVDQQITLDEILDGLDIIAGLINRCTVYELLYLREDSDASKNLKNSMLLLYIAILKFLANAVDKSKENRFTALFTTGNIAGDLQRMEHLEKTVKNDADAAGANSTRNNFQDLRTRLEILTKTMPDIQPQLNDIQHWLEDRDRSEILQWFSAIPYISHHKHISEGRLEGTGQWIFERPEYTKWISSRNSKLLLLRGIPGAGKTYIALKVIDNLHRGATGLKLAYFYCNRAEENRREPDSILHAIIQQLAQSDCDDNKLPKLVVDLYRDRKSKGQASSRLSFSESQKLLVKLTDIYPQTIICIDALDEVADDQRITLLTALNDVPAESKSLVKIFATTRMNPEIVAQFKIFPRIELQPDDNVSDINQFVKKRVQGAINRSELLSGEVSDELKMEICQVLCERSKGMFQLAALQITFLCQFYTTDDVRGSLQTLPDEITDMYNKIYNIITSQKGSAPQLALNAFRWIHCSYEPLRTGTLLHAIRVEVGRSGEFSLRARISANDLLKICQNLLVLDERLDVFRFAHLSFEEYLETKPELNKATSHTEIAKGCLSLLCAPESWLGYENVAITEKGHRDRHLLSYSVLFWPWHYSHSEGVNCCQTLSELWNSFISESNYQRWHNYHCEWVECYRSLHDIF
ncbi:hypothetical protein BZA77DRAFT_16936 [Pyronema omphalodes]|nr:hypothetical protein BZA77DRAFT_16936 [Pyronema omphalodes]